MILGFYDTMILGFYDTMILGVYDTRILGYYDTRMDPHPNSGPLKIVLSELRFVSC